MERTTFEAVDRILVSGQWIDIVPGSLEEAAGVAHRVLGRVEPLYRYTLRDGTTAAVLCSAVQGWAPLVTEEQAKPLFPERPADATDDAFLATRLVAGVVPGA
jgi:hypothetical protein